MMSNNKLNQPLDSNVEYTSQELKNDILANIKTDSTFPPLVSQVINNSVFKFNDTNDYTRTIWDTYKRNLVIFCASEDRLELTKYKTELLDLCVQIHGNRNSYLISSLEIIAKHDIAPIIANTGLTTDDITISSTVTISRKSNKIGNGGFAEVYQYYDEEKEQLFAYKVFSPSVFQVSTPEIMRKRFLREGGKLTRYSHPNIVKAFDYGFLGSDSAYIKMEFISGLKLSDYVLKHSPLDSLLINKLCYEYIDAMSYVHSKKDLHRDISFSNVMINNDNEIKILDFGFSKNNDDTNYDTEFKDIQRKFVIPSEVYSSRTEVYCMGAILFTLITGTLFENYNENLISCVDCCERLKNAVKICLSHLAKDRFENAVVLKEFLHNTTETSLTEAYPLDNFKEIIKLIPNLYFPLGSLPTHEAIVEWLNTIYPEVLEKFHFQSTLNLLFFLKSIPDVVSVSSYQNMNYDVDKTPYIALINFYAVLPEKEQELFAKNIHQIILEHSVENDFLPFT